MKKGQEELMFVFSLIGLVVVLTIFFIVFNLASHGQAKEKINALESNEININLLNYLRTNDTKTGYIIADLITYSYYNNNYGDLKRITQEFFDKFHDKEKCRVMLISLYNKDDSQIFREASLGKEDKNDPGTQVTSSILIPTFDPNENLKVLSFCLFPESGV